MLVVGTLIRDDDTLLDRFRENTQEFRWIALDTGSDDVTKLVSLADVVYKTTEVQSQKILDFRALYKTLFWCCARERATRVARLCPDELLTESLIEQLPTYAADERFDAFTCSRVEYFVWDARVQVKQDFWVVLPAHVNFVSDKPGGLHEWPVGYRAATHVSEIVLHVKTLPLTHRTWMVNDYILTHRPYVEEVSVLDVERLR